MESFDEDKNNNIQNIIYVIEKKYEEAVDKIIKEQEEKYGKLEESQSKYILENRKLNSNIQILIQTQQGNLKNKEFRIDSLNKEIEKRDNELRNLKNFQKKLKLENQSLNRKIISIEKEMNKIKDLNNFLNTNPNIKNEFEILKVLCKSKEEDVRQRESDIEKKNKKIKNLEKILSNQRKVLRENGWGKSPTSINDKSDLLNLNNDSDQKASFGDKMDGSAGYHFERRESGKFGSSSSHDNYGDEYNEKFDSEI